MAAVSQTNSGRGYPQGGEARQWGHKKNSSSHDSRQNFSYPTSFAQSTPPHSPQDFNDYNTQTYPPSSNRNTSRSRHDAEPNRTNGYGSVSNIPNQSRAVQSSAGGAKDKDGDLDDDKWIHRDKLTAIEIQEHIALGKAVPPELLRKMEEGQKRASSRQHGSGRSSDFGRTGSLSKRPRLTTPSPDYESYDEDSEPFVPEDPRSPEEIAADDELDGPPAIYQKRLRSSSSRIPISTNSPLPVPQEHLDRNTRLPRKRGASNDFGEDSIVYPKSRSRSHSVGSQVLLDDDYTPSNPSSPSKAKAPGKGGPASRKASNVRAVSTAKSRTTSTTKGSPATRPTTRDGRPSTAVNRPEGDPPWLASMYKPDPRLPPDQQIIPTHAKRMMQDQWEKEGKVGQVFDKEFRPVALYPDVPPRGDSLPPTNAEAEDTPPPPPLKPSRQGTPEPQRLQLSPQITRGSYRDPQSPTRAQAAANGEPHGGYSTIPKLQSTPVIGSSSPKIESAQKFDIEEQQQSEKGAKSKGCGCCIVM